MDGLLPTTDGAPARATSDDPPPHPPAPARRRLTIRERVDRELRGALVLSVAGLPRRPSERIDDIARGRVRPAGKLPNALEDIASGGAQRERVKQHLVAAVLRAVDLTFDAVTEAA
ncbi:hypothetical protein J421_4634 (plasmid) [Gemmatirosa kalamazoonensis]|uniref:Uncharacterized protein n=1 Tax=Gemmatirosa kalamazoonensis TaxID=861299 RepID=W0RMU6_9BACT|nr:hypothetical protein [Gemmatirosa kalamazoonensis]AHG92101.1 hypothetical protein J421_4566 [Gemmatirosa kalamazoonensis]AHG92169.1 hypothetical protein J421_4634 [Gemmatirosa kalamazoonensis]